MEPWRECLCCDIWTPWNRCLCCYDSNLSSPRKTYRCTVWAVSSCFLIIGELLEENKMEDAYTASKKLMLYGFIGAAILSLVIILTRSVYVNIYRITPEVKTITQQILFAYALVAPFKVLNMILGSGILRSGGKTKFIMGIDLTGTWLFGVPLGLLSAFLVHLSIPYVYFILSIEECIRFIISLILFKSKKWMNMLNP